MQYYDNFIKFVAHTRGQEVHFDTLEDYLGNKIKVRKNLDLDDYLPIFIQLYKQLAYNKYQSSNIKDIEVAYFGNNKFYIKFKKSDKEFDFKNFIKQVYKFKNLKYIYQPIECSQIAFRTCSDLSFAQAAKELSILYDTRKDKEYIKSISMYDYDIISSYSRSFEDWANESVYGFETIFNKYDKFFTTIHYTRQEPFQYYYDRVYQDTFDEILRELININKNKKLTLYNELPDMIDIKEQDNVLYMGFENETFIKELKEKYDVDFYIFPKSRSLDFEFEKSLNQFQIKNKYDIIYIDLALDFMDRNNQLNMIKMLSEHSNKLYVRMYFFDLFDDSYLTQKLLIQFANDIETYVINKNEYNNSYMSLYPIYNIIVFDYIKNMGKDVKVYYDIAYSFDDKIIYEIF